jgi:hypothetical protein
MTRSTEIATAFSVDLEPVARRLDKELVARGSELVTVTPCLVAELPRAQDLLKHR